MKNSGRLRFGNNDLHGLTGLGQKPGRLVVSTWSWLRGGTCPGNTRYLINGSMWIYVIIHSEKRKLANCLYNQMAERSSLGQSDHIR